MQSNAQSITSDMDLLLGEFGVERVSEFVADEE